MTRDQDQVYMSFTHLLLQDLVILKFAKNVMKDNLNG